MALLVDFNRIHRVIHASVGLFGDRLGKRIVKITYSGCQDIGETYDDGHAQAALAQLSHDLVQIDFTARRSGPEPPVLPRVAVPGAVWTYGDMSGPVDYEESLTPGADSVEALRGVDRSARGGDELSGPAGDRP